jgi:SAM-dependent methyltransferase
VNRTDFSPRIATGSGLGLLVHADAERPPFADERFDFAISQYGASIWCDPYRWIPEAARILRPGGRLVFETLTPLVMMCFPTHDDTLPAEATLHRDFFGMHRFEWHDNDGVVDAIEFHLGHGEMIRLLRMCGLDVDDLMELQAPESWVPGTTASLTSGHGGGRAPRSGWHASANVGGLQGFSYRVEVLVASMRRACGGSCQQCLCPDLARRPRR